MTAPRKPEITGTQQELLKRLPGVDVLLEAVSERGLFPDTPRSVVTAAIRDVLTRLRHNILQEPQGVRVSGLSPEALLEPVRQAVNKKMAPNLDWLINATGVVVHTNLGRSLLSAEAGSHLQTIAGSYSNLEFDLAAGRRGSRYQVVRDLLCEISGAEAAMVVNNNAAAVLLSLDTVARDREVVVSRGELVEIGGSFRIPDVMAKSGAILKEVGTTNRTHLFDYRNAINEQTGLLLKVHNSNFGIVGFTSAVALSELVSLARDHGLPVMEDLGSGTFIDFSRYGLIKEPTIGESVAAGTDIVTFSGDKLLGGPQAGIIVGRKELIERIQKNPLNRALRIDKLTLAALESTLRSYRDEARAVREIPTLRMLTMPAAEIAEKAQALKHLLDETVGSRISTEVVAASSRAGGGALPLLELPSQCVAASIRGISATAVERRLRQQRPPVIVRIEDERILMDMRTVQQEELEYICKAITSIASEAEHEACI
ncbi:MAG TPA: L-seryl-tRNA(Sec) selenium transferase [Desulfosalsimonadaceae bacterium]|nr:L-seryl-tRNA(Sec) selenium transferase [Desulfosalsimonadaceae bacterium]